MNSLRCQRKSDDGPIHVLAYGKNTVTFGFVLMQCGGARTFLHQEIIMNLQEAISTLKKLSCVWVIVKRVTSPHPKKCKCTPISMSNTMNTQGLELTIHTAEVFTSLSRAAPRTLCILPGNCYSCLLQSRHYSTVSVTVGLQTSQNSP